MIGITLFSLIIFGAIFLGFIILALTLRQWLKLKFNKKKPAAKGLGPIL